MFDGQLKIETPADPTPAEAAAAIRKFLAGKEPWR